MRRHGTYAMYRHEGCRCADCRAASARYQRRRRAGMPKAAGAASAAEIERRRALGWSIAGTAAALGLPVARVSEVWVAQDELAVS